MQGGVLEAVAGEANANSSKTDGVNLTELCLSLAQWTRSSDTNRVQLAPFLWGTKDPTEGRTRPLYPAPSSALPQACLGIGGQGTVGVWWYFSFQGLFNTSLTWNFWLPAYSQPSAMLFSFSFPLPKQCCWQRDVVLEHSSYGFRTRPLASAAPRPLLPPSSHPHRKATLKEKTSILIYNAGEYSPFWWGTCGPGRGGKSRKMAGHIVPTLRKQEVSWKEGQALKPQRPSPLHSQWGPTSSDYPPLLFPLL